MLLPMQRLVKLCFLSSRPLSAYHVVISVIYGIIPFRYEWHFHLTWIRVLPL
jgi:hypothetical protein